MIYALGRSVEYHDMPAVRRIVRDAKRENYRFSALLAGIAQSEPFRFSTTPAADDTVTAQAAAGRDARVQAGAIAESHDVRHQETSVAAHGVARHGRHHRAAAARCDDSGAYRARAHGRRAHAEARLHLLPARRHHEQVDAGCRRQELRARAVARAARAVQGSGDDRQRSREQARVGPDARDHAGHMAVGRYAHASATIPTAA